MRGAIIFKKKLNNLVDVGCIAVGQVIKTNEDHVKTVKVINMKFDEQYHMYFNKSVSAVCEDNQELSKNGDIVLIERLKNQNRTHLFRKYYIKEVLHKIGEQIDPFATDSYLNVLKNPKTS